MSKNKTTDTTGDQLEDARKFAEDAFTSLTFLSNRIVTDGELSPTLLRDVTCGIVAVARLLERIRWEQIDQEDETDNEDDE